MMEMHGNVRQINLKLAMRYTPMIKVERILKIEEDMLMIRMKRMEPAWRSERIMC